METNIFSDAFSKREKGQEDQYVRQQEMQKYVLKYDIVKMFDLTRRSQTSPSSTKVEGSEEGH